MAHIHCACSPATLKKAVSLLRPQGWTSSHYTEIGQTEKGKYCLISPTKLNSEKQSGTGVAGGWAGGEMGRCYPRAQTPLQEDSVLGANVQRGDTLSSAALGT